MTTFCFVLGTRPETIKLAPVIHAARQRGIRCHVVHTGQHHDAALKADLFAELGLPAPDTELAVGSVSQARQLAHALERLEPVLADLRPDCVIVQGDTTSTLAGGLCANKLGLRLAHVEAGLRSFDRRMPEEHNRVMTDHLADVLLAPTPLQAQNLRTEGLPIGRVHVVGNPVADAVAQVLRDAPPAAEVLARFDVTARRYLLLTLHRQENVDDPRVLAEVLAGVVATAERQDLDVLFPAHPRTVARLGKAGIDLPARVRLIPPCGFADSLRLQQAAAAVLTDSGGMQEETAILGVPCVTLRTSTERPETLDLGCNELAGVERCAVARAAERATERPRGPFAHPYGHGDSGERIVAAITTMLAALPARSAVVPAAAAVTLPSDGDRSGRTLGQEEIELAARAIRSGTLNSTKGTFVSRFEQAFAARMGRKHAVACASGSAAVHCAIAALRPRAGDEFVTTPITDMGALTPILYEGAVPVFADVDPVTLNVTAATIEAQLTDRTRGIIVTHLFGLSCDMGPIVELARARNLPIVEDCAQAFLSSDRLGPVGGHGSIACYSLQQGKHITTGEGGVVTTDDPDLARRVFLFVNKAWGYGDPNPDHYFPALNYRLTELQGAVALAQLPKLGWVVERRRAVAAAITARLAEVPGLQLPQDPQGGSHTFWKYAFMVDPQKVPGGALELGRRMKARGVFCVPRYIQKPAFECALFQDWSQSPVTALPLSQNPRKDLPQPLFRRADYPGTVRGLEHVIVLPINELYTDEHIAFVTTVIREEAARLSTEAA